LPPYSESASNNHREADLRALIVIIGSVFVAPLAGWPLHAGGWYWDIGNGIGFAAFGGLLYLMISSNRQFDVTAHKVLGYLVLALTLSHVFWFLLGDAATIEYMKFGAPDYMWLGLVSLLLLFVLLTIALPPERTRVHRRYSDFKYWHRFVAIATIACAAYHIVISGFYLNGWTQALLFIAIATATCLERDRWARLVGPRLPTPVVFVAVSAFAAVAFAAARNLGS